jgi:hypothetical protein
MSIPYDQTIELQNSNLNYYLTSYAPFSLTIDPSTLTTTQKILEIHYIWGDGNVNVVTYYPSLTSKGQGQYKPSGLIDDGDPRNFTQTNNFYSTSYNISEYNSIVNVYTFGTSKPISYTINSVLLNPPLVNSINPDSAYQEVHLIKTKMYGANNNLVYVFEAQNNNDNDIFMTHVNWSKKPIDQKIDSFKLPYEYVEPFAAKFPIPYNEHISIVPYTSSTLEINPDDGTDILPIDISTLIVDLATNMTDNLMKLMYNAQNDPVGSIPLYSVYDTDNSIYTRSTSCWVSSLDLTCVSVYNSENVGNGILITPRHVLLLNSHFYPEGTEFAFVDTDNNVYTKTLSSSYYNPNQNITRSDIIDITVGVLDSDLPSSITPCKFLPFDFPNHLSTSDIVGLPLLSIDSNQNAYAQDGSRLTYKQTSIQKPTDTVRLLFYQNLSQTPDGDDNNSINAGYPIFGIVDDNAYLLTTLSTAGTNIGRPRPYGTSLIYQQGIFDDNDLITIYPNGNPYTINNLIASADGLIDNISNYEILTADLFKFTFYA